MYWTLNNTNLSEAGAPSHMYETLQRSLAKYFAPLFIVVGTVGNLLTIAVLLRRLRSTQANSTNFYLCVLSLADLVCIYVGLPNYFLSQVYVIDLRDSYEIFCRLHTFLVYTFTHFTVWTLSVVTIDRTIWTALPFKAKELCTIRKAKVIISGIFVALMLVDSHLLWTLHLADVRVKYNVSEPVIQCTEYEMFAEFARVGVTWMDLYLLSIFPFAILITCNCIIIVKLRQYASVRNSLLTSRSGNMSSNTLSASLCGPAARGSSHTQPSSFSSSKEYSLTMMLLTTSVFFIATTLPITVCNFIYVTVDSTLIHDTTSAAAMTLLQTFATLLSYLNISVQFVLFCLSGKSFRNEVSAYLLELLNRVRGRGRQKVRHTQPPPRSASSVHVNGTSTILDQQPLVHDPYANWLRSPQPSSSVNTIVTKC